MTHRILHSIVLTIAAIAILLAAPVTSSANMQALTDTEMSSVVGQGLVNFTYDNLKGLFEANFGFEMKLAATINSTQMGSYVRKDPAPFVDELGVNHPFPVTGSGDAINYQSIGDAAGVQLYAGTQGLGKNVNFGGAGTGQWDLDLRGVKFGHSKAKPLTMNGVNMILQYDNMAGGAQGRVLKMVAIGSDDVKGDFRIAQAKSFTGFVNTDVIPALDGKVAENTNIPLKRDTLMNQKDFQDMSFGRAGKTGGSGFYLVLANYGDHVGFKLVMGAKKADLLNLSFR